MSCIIQGQYRKIADKKDEKTKKEYMKKVAGIVANMEDGETTAHLTYLFSNLYNETFKPKKNVFVDINYDFNEFVSEMTSELESKIESSDDPLELAIIYSRIGNYIDYGVMDKVDKEDFLKLFETKERLDSKTYTKFKEDLGRANTLLLTADNCGEIVLDKLLLKTIHKLYPHLKIQAMVKGDYALNDATLIDAAQIGLDEVAEVISTQNNMIGCDIRYLGDEAKDALYKADLIISKGQANFETLLGCDLNIYYSFLCKCDHFAGLFNVEKLTGMFVNEKDISF